MGPVPGRREHAVLVRGVRRAHGDGVQPAREHPVGVGVPVRHAVRRGEGAGPVGVEVGHRRHLDPGDVPQGGHVVAGDQAAAEDADPHGQSPPVRLLIACIARS
jgi:hypothetical protein